MMPSISFLNVLLLLTPLLATAQQPGPPLQLDEHGEAHFNIPVVVKLAPSAANPVGRRVRRSDNGDASESSNNNNGEREVIAAVTEGGIQLAPPVFIDPDFEITHQGAETSDSDDDDDDDYYDDNDGDDQSLDKRSVAGSADHNAAAGAPAAAPPPQELPTHTILLVETTGMVTSTQDCDNSSSASSSSAPSTEDIPALNHTGSPLRNGTNGTLPCNATYVNGTRNGTVAGAGAGIKPSGSGSGAAYDNPMNVVGNKSPGTMQMTAGSGRSWSVQGSGWYTSCVVVVVAAVVFVDLS